jgi:hypothetical protein
MFEFPRIIVDGDARNGWLVEIHDGKTCKVYSPKASDSDAARSAAYEEHFGVLEPGSRAEMEAARAKDEAEAAARHAASENARRTFEDAQAEKNAAEKAESDAGQSA